MVSLYLGLCWVSPGRWTGVLWPSGACWRLCPRAWLVHAVLGCAASFPAGCACVGWPSFACASGSVSAGLPLVCVLCWFRSGLGVLVRAAGRVSLGAGRFCGRPRAWLGPGRFLAGQPAAAGCSCVGRLPSLCLGLFGWLACLCLVAAAWFRSTLPLSGCQEELELRFKEQYRV